MASQLKIRIDAENGVAVVSRSAVAAAAVAGGQAFAVTALAQPVEEGDESVANPIFYPEFWYGVAAAAVAGAAVGAVVGVCVTKMTNGQGRKSKDDE